MADAASELVQRFCLAWEKNDFDALTAMVTDDVVYHNIPWAPLNGKEAVLKSFGEILRDFSPLRFEILRTAVDGNVVFNERVDHLTVKGNAFSLPVVGVFEVQDGKIAAWRDYFDAGKMRKALAAG